MQAVHDQHDGALLLVVQPAVEGMVEPLVGRPPLGLRQGLLGLQRIIDDDQVGTPPGQYAADRGREPAALRRRLELPHRLPLGREARRVEPLIPIGCQDPPAVARQFVGELLGIAGADDLRCRIVPETPGGKGDRGQQRLQITRRHVDDQAHHIDIIKITSTQRDADGPLRLSTAIGWNEQNGGGEAVFRRLLGTVGVPKETAICAKNQCTEQKGWTLFFPLFPAVFRMSVQPGMCGEGNKDRHEQATEAERRRHGEAFRTRRCGRFLVKASRGARCGRGHRQ